MRFLIPLRQHREVLAEVLARLAGSPAATAMTVLVLAAALALPAAFWVITDNLERLGQRLEAPGTMTLFLERDDPPQEAVKSRLDRQRDVTGITYVSPEEALEEASRLLGLGESLEGLPENPLPGSFEITLAPDRRQPARMAALAETMEGWPGVTQVQYDRRWVERFQAAVGVLRQVGVVVGALVGAVVVLVIANTIRLAVAGRRREIEVIKMIGGTDAFVRLPFLYMGLIQGLLAALVATGLVAAGVTFLSSGVAELAAQYGAGFGLRDPGFDYLGVMLAIGGGLGWLGSRLVVGRHLRAVEPE